MADEVTIRSTFYVRKGNLKYGPMQNTIQSDLAVARGPAPGFLTVPVLGVDLDLSALTTPGPVWICNTDATNFLTYGVRDPETNKFYPVHEILPGEAYPARWSRYLSREYSGTGAGTTGPSTNVAHLRADTAPITVIVDSFDAASS